MTDFNQVLLTILLALSAILVVFLIVICIKILYTTDKLNIILTDVEKKLKTVNGVFDAIDGVTDAITTISERIVSKVLYLIDKVTKNKNREE